MESDQSNYTAAQDWCSIYDFRLLTEPNSGPKKIGNLVMCLSMRIFVLLYIFLYIFYENGTVTQDSNIQNQRNEDLLLLPFKK